MMSYTGRQITRRFSKLGTNADEDVIMNVNRIIPLEEQGRGAGLRQLWQQDDPRMMAAYLLFVEDHQEDEFIDTLARLSSVEKPVHAQDQRNDEREIASSLMALHSAGKISQEMLENLEAEDPKIAAAFDVYESDLNMVRTHNSLPG